MHRATVTNVAVSSTASELRPTASATAPTRCRPFVTSYRCPVLRSPQVRCRFALRIAERVVRVHGAVHNVTGGETVAGSGHTRRRCRHRNGFEDAGRGCVEGRRSAGDRTAT